jgi:hypothetical protein
MVLPRCGASGELARRANRRRRADVYKAGVTCQTRCMIELLRTNDAVLLSFAEALMRDAGIRFFVADRNMSIIEGSIGILPRRLLVDEEDVEEARRILEDAGIAHEIRR